MANTVLEPQDLEFPKGSAPTFTFTVLDSQYPEGAAFNVEMNFFKSGTAAAVLSVTDSITISSGEFELSLTAAQTDALDAVNHKFKVWDVSNDQELAFGIATVLSGKDSY